MSETEPLNKRIASAGIASRRKAVEIIAAGRVEVNGASITEPGFRVGEDDEVTVDGRPIETSRKFYLALNKPKGYITTMNDPFGRRTIVELLPKLSAPVKPVGRLDKDTEGLLILTNDGELAQRLTHPRFSIEKEYVVTVEGIPDAKRFDKLRSGIWIPGGKTSPATVEGIFADEKRNRCRFHITIHEGRKRQIREMCHAIGHEVKELKRVRIGPLGLAGLPKGEVRMISGEELQRLCDAVGLDGRPRAKGRWAN